MADAPAAATKPSSSVKLVLLGEAAVGKVCGSIPRSLGLLSYGRLTKLQLEPQSSLVLRFVNNDFQENKEPTIGGMYPFFRMTYRGSLDRPYTATFLRLCACLHKHAKTH